VAILYQDYPFALADLFLKRALVLIGLVTAAFGALTISGIAQSVSTSQLGLIAVCSVVTALGYPWLKRGTSWFVDRVVFRRPDYRLLESRLASQLQVEEHIGGVVAQLASTVAAALSAAHVESVSASEPMAPGSSLVHVSGASIIRLSIPVTEPPSYVAAFRLSGGRRVLSDDVAALTAMALLAGRRIDAIRLAQERYQSAIREQEMATLATEAELRALRAQLNPHFLFNALTTLGHLIQTAPDRAFVTLMRLTGLLRAVLRSDGQYTTLGRELDLVLSYLEIERERFEDRLVVDVRVAEQLRGIRVPSLILQPLVENAVKHGITTRRVGGHLSITATVEASDGHQDRLCIRVADTGEGVRSDVLALRRATGVGLRNVERRLAGCYGADGVLTLTSRPGVGTVAELRLPVSSVPADRKAG
jgi:signal transduction histidine kinase